MEIALEAGAEDIQSDGEVFEVYTTQQAYEAVLDAIKTAGIEPDDAEVGKYADTTVSLEGSQGPADAEAHRGARRPRRRAERLGQLRDVRQGDGGGRCGRS